MNMAEKVIAKFGGQTALAKMVNKTRKAREKFTEEMGRRIEESLAAEKLKARVVGRAKHLYSIYQKMERQNLTFDQIFDIIGFRIIVGSVKESYEASASSTRNGSLSRAGSKTTLPCQRPTSISHCIRQ
jgi:ppGpp synthetase/RelA/SpoT-type nucleotidyltranferase